MQRPEPATSAGRRSSATTSAGIVGPRLTAPRWVVAGLAVVLAIALAEAIALVEGPPVCASDTDVLLAPDDEVGWTFTPNLTVTVDPCVPPGTPGAWSAPVSINAAGLHDQPWPWQKPRGEVRVLVLGNEIADGVGVARADRLSVRLGHLTDRTRGARVAAINATIPGYGPAEARRFLERRGLRWSPDVVVLLVDAARDPAAVLDPPEMQVIAADVPPASGLMALSASARWLARRPAELPERRVRLDEPVPLDASAGQTTARARLLDEIRSMAATSRDAGAGLAVAIAPRCPLDVSPEALARAAELCTAIDAVAPCVDLTPVFADLAATKGTGELCIPGQPRWGRDAHFLASHKIWDTLGERSLWPPTVVRGHRL